MAESEEWTVWGDDPEPVKEGSEADCKEYVTSHIEQDSSLYVSSPDGKDYEYNDGKWEEC